MERSEFKERLKQYKKAREENPGLKYYDFMERLAEFKAKEWGDDPDMVLTHMLNDNSYNYRLMYEDDPNYNMEEGHFVDTYKTVYHPTFSEESMYSGKRSQYNPEGIIGGSWDESTKSFYLNDKRQSKQKAQDYLNYADPGYRAIPKYDEGGEVDNQYSPIWPKISKTERQIYFDRINPAAGFGFGDFIAQGMNYYFPEGERQKAPKEDEARWAAYLGLPYDKTYAPDTKVRFAHDKDYPNRQYQGLSKDAKNEIREEIIPILQKSYSELGDKWIQITDAKPTDIIRKDEMYYPRLNHIGDLGKFGVREVNGSGIYEVGDKYDFPWYVPIPNRADGYELMIRDTIWSDKAKPELYIQRKAEGGEVESDRLEYDINETKDWLRNWYNARLLYGKQYNTDIINQISAIHDVFYPLSYQHTYYWPWGEKEVSKGLNKPTIDNVAITVNDQKIKEYNKKHNVIIGGYQHPEEGIVLPSNYNPIDLVHEMAHTYNTYGDTFSFVNKAITDELGYVTFPVGLTNPEYWTSPSEVHSRLMLFRKENNINPLKKHTIEDVKEIRKKAKDKFLFEIFDDYTMLKLLNDVAENTVDENRTHKSKRA